MQTIHGRNSLENMKLQHSLLTLLASSILFLGACESNKKSEEKEEQSTTQKSTADTKEKKPAIIFFGNSLTAGYGVDPKDAFAGRIAQRIDSLDYNYEVINAGVSGETTASGLSRVEWVIKRANLSIFVLELGGNDGLRGINPEETEKNLKAIINKVRELHPEAKIILSGMMVPPNMGDSYANEFKAIYPKIAAEKNVVMIPFLLKDVGGVASLNLPDGIHPTEEGHKIVTETVWTYLKPLL